METSQASTLLAALGQPADSHAVTSIALALSTTATAPLHFEQKQLGPVLYHSSPAHGISLQFERSDPHSSHATCRAIDVYNDGYDKRWSGYPNLPLALTLQTAASATDGVVEFGLASDTTGVQLVTAFGEPQRTGGGEPLRGGGASGLGPGAWMEWTLTVLDRQQQPMQVVVMVELAGADVRGANRWEKNRAGAARWGVCTFSLPSE